MKILHVVGARPNFMKIAPIMKEMARYPDCFEQILVHTGQHYDNKMSQVFFDDLDIPQPDVYLNVGSGSHAEQTARIMLAFEPVLLKYQPDWILVVGDVNSTLACALVAAKLCIPVAHVEAGLRSFNRAMPEEVNRILTDQIADLLFTTEKSANENLAHEGIPGRKIHFVGNTMIDTLLQYKKPSYALLTLHRPSNVDVPGILGGILCALTEIQAVMPIIFPAHPRTMKRIQEFGFGDRLAAMPNLRVIEPLGYLEFLNLMVNARLVLTDSGGIQEETTALGVPCLTLREETERPITVAQGTNVVVGHDPQRIIASTMAILDNSKHTPKLWDGHAAERIVSILKLKGEQND